MCLRHCGSRVCGPSALTSHAHPRFSPVVCSTGVCESSYIIVSFVLFARQRKFPTDMVMYLSLAQLLFPLSQLLCINSVIDDDYSSTKALFVYGASMTFRYGCIRAGGVLGIA